MRFPGLCRTTGNVFSINLPPMRPTPRAYSPLHRISSLLMMLALLWLSVCTPFVYAAQKGVKATTEQQADCDEDAPLTNTNEEKSEGGISLPQEYLHEPLHLHHPVVADRFEFHRYAADAHVSYHPDLISPPPDALL